MGRIFWQFDGILLLVGFVGAYFWWIVATAAVVGLVYYGHRASLTHCSHVADLEAERAELVPRADQQHAWVMAGDQRGTYGAFPPASPVLISAARNLRVAVMRRRPGPYRGIWPNGDQGLTRALGDVWVLGFPRRHHRPG